MSNSAKASLVIPIPIDTVWKHIRAFDFPKKLIPSQIKECKLLSEEGFEPQPTTVGCIREIQWHDSEDIRRHRLLCVDDYHYRLIWELHDASRESEVSAHITTISCVADTHTNSTLCVWESRFSSDAKVDFIKFERSSYEKNLLEMSDKLQEICRAPSST